MKAVHLSHYKNKLMDVSGQLYLENKWEMPKGLIDKNLKNPLNYTRAEWQQTLRTGQNPKVIDRFTRKLDHIFKHKQEMKPLVHERQAMTQRHRDARVNQKSAHEKAGRLK